MKGIKKSWGWGDSELETKFGVGEESQGYMQRKKIAGNPSKQEFIALEFRKYLRVYRP